MVGPKIVVRIDTCSRAHTNIKLPSNGSLSSVGRASPPSIDWWYHLLPLPPQPPGPIYHTGTIIPPTSSHHDLLEDSGKQKGRNSGCRKGFKGKDCRPVLFFQLVCVIFVVVVARGGGPGPDIEKLMLLVLNIE